MSEPAKLDQAAPLVLIVEDEPEISSVLVAYFEREDFRVVTAADGDTALQHHLSLAPDLVILDVKLPKKDGFEILGTIRQRGDTPVIMATALGEDLEKLTAFRVGADDYVVKPFNPIELVARSRAVLRRGAGQQMRTLRQGVVELDLEGHIVRVSSDAGMTSLDLTPTQFKLLHHMMRSPRRAFSRADLLDACLEDRDAVERTIDSHVSNLRRKLSKAGADGYCTGVRGIGYRFLPG